MTDQRHKHRISETTRLNATPLSTHIKTLLTQSKAPPDPNSLVMVELLRWTVTAGMLTPEEVRTVNNLAQAADAADEPENAYRMLAEAESEMMEAQDAQDAAKAMLLYLADNPIARLARE